MGLPEEGQQDRQDTPGTDLSDVFQGRLPIEDALSHLRLRLLDLTAKNRLLNYRPSSAKSLQVVDAVPDAVYGHLVDGKQCTFLPVPDPPTTEYRLQDGRRAKPEVREYAKQLGISTTYELPEQALDASSSGVGGARLRVLLYPEDLERQCRRIARDAQSAIEETGTNMLYLVFGFLEFYESDDSERPLNAPLIAVPVSLKRGTIDPFTRLYRYDLSYTGDEISGNLSLHEKLKKDFGIQMPEVKEDEQPDKYLGRIRDVISRKSRWRVKRQITLALLSFAKMMLVRDLDPQNWPREGKGGSKLTEHPIVRQVFEGGKGLGEHLEDYLIDEHKEYGLELIYDADTSQHSTLIDALAGNNLVVNGPPGTGKSQTITNLIAAAMVRGKTILFVSEKLAALEVVKHRLDQAGLGDFCLELHSHKTDKKRVVEEIKKRIKGHYGTSPGLGDKLDMVEKHRRRLKRYADLMNSQAGNELGLTVFEILWRAEHHRQKAGPQVVALEPVVLEDAPHATQAHLDEMRQAVEDLAGHYREIDAFGPTHPWYGFFLTSLIPGADLAIQRLLKEFIEGMKALDKAMVALRHTAKEEIPIETEALKDFVHRVDGLSEPAPRVVTDMLLRLFPPADPEGLTSMGVVEGLKALCDKASGLTEVFTDKLLYPGSVNAATSEEVQPVLQTLRGWKVAGRTLEELEGMTAGLRTTADPMRGMLDFFEELAPLAGIPFDGTDASIQQLHGITGIASQAPRDLLPFRHPGLNQPVAMEILSKARAQLDRIKRQQKRLDEIFWLDENLEGAGLYQAIQTLRQGDAWYRFLQSDWRRACLFHKTLSRDKKARKSGEERLVELSALAEHFKTLKQFGKHGEYSGAFGSLFKGTDTDLDKVERLITWYEKGREALVRLGLGPAEFDLNTFDAFALAQLALRHMASQREYEAICHSAERISALLPDTETCPGALDRKRPWAERLKALGAFVSGLDTSLCRLKGIGPASLTPEELLQAVMAKCNYDAVLEKLKDNVIAKDLLGECFAGLNTDFASVLETFTWGQRVAKAGLPEATKRVLLSPQAAERVRALKQAAASAWEATGFIQRFEEDIRRHGIFDRAKWGSGPFGEGQGSMDMMRVRATFAINNMDRLLPWAQYNNARAAVDRLGLDPFREKLEAGEINPALLVDGFRYRFHASIATSLFRSNPELQKFSTISHEQIRGEFAQLDKEIISLRGRACAAGVARGTRVIEGTGTKVNEKTEMALFSHLMTLKKLRTPIRQMIRRAGRSTQALKPCFMMGPLSVAQYLEPGAVEFDIVVMDEASQLKPEEALGTIARGRQLIVVGDPKQLPPTSFFDKMMTVEDEDEEGSTLTTSESILDICMPLFQSRTLRWHYRSKHESLIAFSNHHFYDGNLIVFPSPYPKTKRLGVRYHYISNGVYQNRQNFPEATRVVDAVIEHMRNHREESLGVVTLSITQRDLIEEILEKRLKNFEEGEAYKTHWEKEGWPFFVKNLENVQGDERDAIFISTTFGRVLGTDKVRQNFGPISRSDGWRRLNVLFTRARKSLHVFSSMRPEDIVDDSKTPEGTRTLRNYLEYAECGKLPPKHNGDGGEEREPDSDFEISVANVLRSKGYEIQPQLGVAGFFIDIAVRNPERRGEFIAAIECDGATYHSGVSVRDRDRIRQEILESLGWKGKIWRIWSTDWFRGPQDATQRLLKFLEDRRAATAKEPVFDSEEPMAEETAFEKAETGPSELRSEVQPVDEDEELYVEVGDTVTYCDLREPEKKLQVLLTDGPSNFDQGIINEATPLAKTLLDSREGDEVDLVLPGMESRKFRVLKIWRKA